MKSDKSASARHNGPCVSSFFSLRIVKETSLEKAIPFCCYGMHVFFLFVLLLLVFGHMYFCLVFHLLSLSLAGASLSAFFSLIFSTLLNQLKYTYAETHTHT